jgi:mono/diheme cytochrome c family protein
LICRNAAQQRDRLGCADLFGGSRMRRAIPPILAALAVTGCAALAGPPRTVLAPQVEAGRQYAQRACSGCHAMTPARVSVDRGAPPFWSLAGRHTPESLMQATQTAPAHEKLAMPSVILTRSEAGALVAYIEALGRAPRSAWRDLDVSPCISTAHC